jgi:hypothetical protein
MADATFRAEQHATALTAPHIAPINQFVDSIQDRDGMRWAPYVAPLHGGVDAQVLSILRDPGPATQDESGSGFVAIENDDPTAERQVKLFESAGISPRQVLPWNAYPWYFTRQPTASELDAGARAEARRSKEGHRLLEGDSDGDGGAIAEATWANDIP